MCERNQYLEINQATRYSAWCKTWKWIRQMHDRQPSELQDHAKASYIKKRRIDIRAFFLVTNQFKLQYSASWICLHPQDASSCRWWGLVEKIGGTGKEKNRHLFYWMGDCRSGRPTNVASLPDTRAISQDDLQEIVDRLPFLPHCVKSCCMVAY